MIVGFLVYGRFRRNGYLQELLLVCSLAVVAVANLLLTAIPTALELAGDVELSSWAPVVVRFVATLLLVAAAFTPPAVRVSGRKLGPLLLGAALVVTGIAVSALLLGGELPSPVDPSSVPNDATRPSITGHPVLLTAHALSGLLYGLAAIAFTYTTEALTISVVSADQCASVSNPAAPSFTAAAAPASGWHTTVPAATAMSTTAGAVISYSTDGTTFVSAAPTLAEGIATVTAKATDGTCPTKTSTSSREFKVDTVAPGASPANVVNATWRNTSLVQEFTFTDVAPGSGLAADQGLDNDGKVTVTASEESAGETSPTVASVTINDVAANSTTRSVSALIDLTKPTSSVAGVTDGAVYTQAPTVTCPGNDELSGIASHGTVSGNTDTAGVKTVSCNGATDNAGNVQTAASDTVSYTLALIGGFNSNFDGSAVLRVKPNQAIPLKWAFSDGTNNLALLTSATISSVSSSRCRTQAGEDGTEVAPESAAGSSGLQLLPDNSYQMNWKANSTTGCRALTVTMAGASSRTILVDIKK